MSVEINRTFNLREMQINLYKNKMLKTSNHNCMIYDLVLLAVSERIVDEMLLLCPCGQVLGCEIPSDEKVTDALLKNTELSFTFHVIRNYGNPAFNPRQKQKIKIEYNVVNKTMKSKFVRN